jgi:hypothetical protein
MAPHAGENDQNGLGTIKRLIASFCVAHRSRDFRIAHPRCETFSASMAHDAAGLRSVKPKTKH